MVGQIYAVENPIGKLGIVGEMAVGRAEEFRRAIRAMAVAVFALSAIFSLGGDFLISAFGVDIIGLKIAGGVVILATSILTLVQGSSASPWPRTVEAAVVPLATPLIVGPGTMTTLILFSGLYGSLATLGAATVASALSVATLYLGSNLVKAVGPLPARALGRFMSLIIATVGTQLVLSGVSQYVAGLCH